MHIVDIDIAMLRSVEMAKPPSGQAQEMTKPALGEYGNVDSVNKKRHHSFLLLDICSLKVFS